MDTPSREELSKGHGRIIFDEYLRRKYPKFYKYLSNNYLFTDDYKEKAYCYNNNINKQPLCPACGKPTKFHGITYGYAKFCGPSCAGKDPEVRQKLINTCINKYGDNYSNLIHERSVQTMIERYGVDNSMKVDKFKEKSKQTCLEKYGVDNPMKSQKIQNKSKQTCLKKYGVEYSLQSDIVKEKTKQTNLKKYGVEYNFQSEYIKNKRKQTCLERYGVEHTLQIPEIREIIKKTNLKKYGTEYGLQSDIIREKSKKTCLEKYGGVGFASTELANKVKKICLEKYGVEIPSQSKEIQDKAKQTCLEKYGTEHYAQSQEYQYRHDEIQTKINNTKHKNHTFSTSQIETEFADYLTSQHIEYIRQYKSELYPFNCDFYIPKYDIYVEIQAGWFHGHHPYNCNGESDKDILERWKSKNTDFYKTAIEIWTKRDVKKREVAKQNQLNYLEIFSNNINEVVEQFELYIKHLNK